MDLEERKSTRKKQRTRMWILVVLALILGFVIGAIFGFTLLQDNIIVISESDKTGISSTTGNINVFADIKSEDSASEESLLPETGVEMTPTKEPIPEENAKNNKIIVIDAGHQQKGNFSKEPIAPGASQKKAKVAGGTTGVSTKIPEYKVTLEVALLLEQELKSRGYEVIMIRRTHDVDISNSQRATIANDANAAAFIRIHCNGSENSNAKGALTMCQTRNNPYCGNLYNQSRSLSERVIEELCRETGAKNLGVSETDTMSGINWCSVPVTIVEMGFMTNYEEDKLLCDASYQQKLATGIANGIDCYFG